MKKCRECSATKPLTEFYPDSHSKDGLQARCRACFRTYYLANKDRINDRTSKWREANPDRARQIQQRADRSPRKKEQSKAYRDANRAACNVRTAAWTVENRERKRRTDKTWRAENAARIREQDRSWVAANRAKVCARASRYRASKLRATPRWADQEKVLAIYAEAQRLSEQAGIEYHVDHIVPLQSSRVCGLHCEANLQILLGAENKAKRNHRWPDM